MNVKFLEGAFASIPKKTVEIAVSNINAYRNFIGNGVAVGKLAEVIIAKMFCNEDDGVHGFSFAFTGKNPPFDILVYRREKALKRSTFFALRRLYQVSFAAFCEGITKEVGSGAWCGISLKNYLNYDSQVTTNYGIRTVCENMLGTEFKRYSDAATVNKVLDVAREELSHEIILLLNSFPDTKGFQFRLFNLDSLKIVSITYDQKTKHSRYIFGNEKGDVFHVKYGKNQANPFQRGIWIDDLDKLPLLAAGKYHETAFGRYILDGALKYHKPQDGDEEGLGMGEHAADNKTGQLPFSE